MLQAWPGRSGTQQYQQNSPNLGPTFQPKMVIVKFLVFYKGNCCDMSCLCFLAPHSPGSPSGLAALRDELLRPRLLRGRSKAAEDLLARHGLLGTIFLIAILHHVDAVNAGKKRLGWRYSLEGLIGRSDGMMMCESWLIRRIIWLWPVGRRGRYDVVRSRRFS